MHKNIPLSLLWAIYSTLYTARSDKCMTSPAPESQTSGGVTVEVWGALGMWPWSENR